jgi:hypothetical protein
MGRGGNGGEVPAYLFAPAPEHCADFGQPAAR